MTIVVCDDEIIFKEKVFKILYQYREEHSLSYDMVFFTSGTELLKYKEQFFLVFLDIEMPGLDGLEVARCLKQNNRDAIIVFLTSYPEMMQKAFEVRAFRYLLKPLSKDALYECMNAVMDELEVATVMLYKGGILKIVKTKNILYIEAGIKNTIVRTEDGIYESKNSMVEWDDRLTGGNFFRCHKTYFVNLAYVDEIQKVYATLYNSERVAVSRRNRKEFELRMLNYIKRNAR